MRTFCAMLAVLILISGCGQAPSLSISGPIEGSVPRLDCTGKVLPDSELRQYVDQDVEILAKANCYKGGTLFRQNMRIQKYATGWHEFECAHHGKNCLVRGKIHIVEGPPYFQGQQGRGMGPDEHLFLEMTSFRLAD